MVYVTVHVSHQGRKMGAAALAKYRAAGDNMTDLQHHVEFFDKNKDGIITITESIQCACIT